MKLARSHTNTCSLSGHAMFPMCLRIQGNSFVRVVGVSDPCFWGAGGYLLRVFKPTGWKIAAQTDPVTCVVSNRQRCMKHDAGPWHISHWSVCSLLCQALHVQLFQKYFPRCPRTFALDFCRRCWKQSMK